MFSARSIPMAEANIELADIMSRRFTLLKQEFGHWQVRNQVVYFAHSKAIGQLNGRPKIANDKGRYHSRLKALVDGNSKS
jgi:hypothetical protein